MIQTALYPPTSAYSEGSGFGMVLRHHDTNHHCRDLCEPLWQYLHEYRGEVEMRDEPQTMACLSGIRQSCVETTEPWLVRNNPCMGEGGSNKQVCTKSYREAAVVRFSPVLLGTVHRGHFQNSPVIAQSLHHSNIAAILKDRPLRHIFFALRMYTGIGPPSTDSRPVPLGPITTDGVIPLASTPTRCSAKPAAPAVSLPRNPSPVAVWSCFDSRVRHSHHHVRLRHVAPSRVSPP